VVNIVIFGNYLFGDAVWDDHFNKPLKLIFYKGLFCFQNFNMYGNY
jgi:hypothetical protein